LKSPIAVFSSERGGEGGGEFLAGRLGIANFLFGWLHFADIEKGARVKSMQPDEKAKFSGGCHTIF